MFCGFVDVGEEIFVKLILFFGLNLFLFSLVYRFLMNGVNVSFGLSTRVETIVLDSLFYNYAIYLLVVMCSVPLDVLSLLFLSLRYSPTFSYSHRSSPRSPP